MNSENTGHSEPASPEAALGLGAPIAAAPSTSGPSTSGPTTELRDETVRTLAPHALLFEAGRPRTRVFRIETGAVCSFRLFPDGRREVIEFAVAGDIVGLGGLDRHMWSAEAVTETRITCLPASVQDELVARDPAIRARLVRAIDRQLVVLRREMVDAGAKSPLVRVAAYLLAISGINASEGRDREFIGDDLQCGEVADLLGFDIDELAGHLSELVRRSLLAFCPPHGLRLLDVQALEQLADGA